MEFLDVGTTHPLHISIELENPELEIVHDIPKGLENALSLLLDLPHQLEALLSKGVIWEWDVLDVTICHLAVCYGMDLMLLDSSALAQASQAVQRERDRLTR